MPRTSSRVLDLPSLPDLYAATRRRAAHRGGSGHVPGEPGAFICDGQARSDA